MFVHAEVRVGCGSVARHGRYLLVSEIERFGRCRRHDRISFLYPDQLARNDGERSGRFIGLKSGMPNAKTAEFLSVLESERGPPI